MAFHRIGKTIKAHEDEESGEIILDEVECTAPDCEFRGTVEQVETHILRMQSGYSGVDST